MLFAQRRHVDVATRCAAHRRIEPAVDDQHLLRRVLGQAQRLVDQVLVGHRLAAAHAGVGGDHHARLGVVDAGREARRSEAAEHHRMDRTQPHRGEHGENRLGDHRQVEQHPVAAPDAERLQHRRPAVDLGVQFAVGVGALLAGLGRDVDQCRLIGAPGQMAVDRVVAEIGFAADEPARERQPAAVEHLLERLVPVDAGGLLTPEVVGLLDRAAVEFRIAQRHARLRFDVFCGPETRMKTALLKGCAAPLYLGSRGGAEAQKL